MMNERKVTMLSIQFLAKMCEALIRHASRGRSEGQSSSIECAARCADAAEHIAQYDSEGLELKFRLGVIVTMMEDLRGMRERFDPILSTVLLHTPSTADIDELILHATAMHQTA